MGKETEEGFLEQQRRTQEQIHVPPQQGELQNREDSTFQMPQMRTMGQRQTQLDATAVQTMPVKFAQRTAQEQGYAKKNSSSVSAGKRSRRAEKMRFSRLYKKRENAEKVQEAQSAYGRQLEEDRRRMFGENSGYDLDAQRMFTAIFSPQEQPQELPADPKELYQPCVDQFLAQEDPDSILRGWDSDSDEKFAAHMGSVEQYVRQVEAMNRMETRFGAAYWNPKETTGSPEERRAATDKRNRFSIRLRRATTVAEYLQARSLLITNPYYRSHYNSELSYRVNQGDTAQQRYVTQLIWLVEQKRAEIGGEQLNLPAALSAEEQERERKNHTDLVNATTLKETTLTAPAGTNVMVSELPAPTQYDARKKTYFEAQMPNDTAFQRQLGRQDYHVQGTNARMAGAVARNPFVFTEAPAMARMGFANMKTMIERIIAVPEEAENPEQAEACRQENIKGLRELQRQLLRHTNYLMRKYGHGLSVISPEELALHAEEISADASWSQSFWVAMDYMRDLQRELNLDPPLYDESDEALSEARQYQDYFNKVSTAISTNVKAYTYDNTEDRRYMKAKGFTNYEEMSRHFLDGVSLSTLGSAQPQEIVWNLEPGLAPDGFEEMMRGLDDEKVLELLSQKGYDAEAVDQMEVRWSHLADSPGLNGRELLRSMVETPLGNAIYQEVTRAGNNGNPNGGPILQGLKENLAEKAQRIPALAGASFSQLKDEDAERAGWLLEVYQRAADLLENCGGAQLSQRFASIHSSLREDVEGIQEEYRQELSGLLR